MVNKYAGTCVNCKGNVEAGAGILKQSKRGSYYVLHLACSNSRKKQVDTITFSSGESMTQNTNGRCIDAPCCGCCT